MRLKTLPVLMAIGVFLVGCNLPGPGEGSPSSRDLITAEDIATTSAQNAYEVVERFQPQWLTSRGNVSVTNSAATVASVFVNGIQVGDVEYLRNLLPHDIAEMRYYNAGEAGARFGMGHPRGVIAVTLK